MMAQMQELKRIYNLAIKSSANLDNCRLKRLCRYVMLS